MVHVALLIMVKNEQARLSETLNSVIGTVDSIVAFDTGSTDDTIGILKRFSQEHNIPLRLKEGEFIDFSTSRNTSLDFADTFNDIDFLLLLDCNDEIRGGEGLIKFCEEYKYNTEVTAYHVRQEWWTGNTAGSISFYTLRLLKPRTGWRYTGVVHEYIRNTNGRPIYSVKVEDESTVIYQDRTKDDNKSLKRFSKDKELLLTEHKRNPEDTRTVFYLAQTYGCLHEHEDAFKYYKKRSEMDGFREEVFFSLLKCGELLGDMNRDWNERLVFFMKALEHTKRVEPAMRIAEYYKDKGEWMLAYTFADLACNMKYPKDSVLFVNRHKYEYERWHLLGIIAYYAGFYSRGKIACEIAIRNGHNTDLDKSNLKFYEDKLR